MVEEAPFKVLSRHGELEIRRYERITVATVKGLTDNASFRILFDYISGNNTVSERISMTAPVLSSQKIPMTAPVLSGEGTFSFVLPDGMSSRAAPKPNNTAIAISVLPPRILGVIRFSGRATQSKVRKMEDKLMNAIKENRLRSKGAPFLMRYNSPFVPGPFRRNEIAVEMIRNA
ncbi:MAG: SOUL family heme-binding protein [Thermoplasmatota archaeon]